MVSDPIPNQGGLALPDHLPVFYIAATTSLQERRPRTLKHGETFAVFDHNGDIIQGPSSLEASFMPTRDTPDEVPPSIRSHATRRRGPPPPPWPCCRLLGIGL